LVSVIGGNFDFSPRSTDSVLRFECYQQRLECRVSVPPKLLNWLTVAEANAAKFDVAELKTNSVLGDPLHPN
jgi:hypothetical protein